MKVLVTGGGGYIGSLLCASLVEKGYDVVCFDRFFFGKDKIKDIEDRVTIVKDDVRFFDPKILDGVDAVFDLAALSNDVSGELDANKTLEINYKGRVRVATLAKAHGVKKYVLASSCSVYGFQDGLVDEKSKTNPLTTYAKANLLAEKETLELSSKDFSVTALRQATVYGYSPRMRFDLAINVMALSLFRDGKIMVTGKGEQWRPFVHVKDTGNAFIKVIEADQELVNGEVFNVGSNNQNYNIFDLAKLVCEANGKEFSYESFGDPDFRSYKAKFDKISNVIGYKTSKTPRDGAQEVYNALKENILDPKDPKTVTVNWYKRLIEMQNNLREVELNGVLL